MEETIGLSFEYSKALEKERITNTISRLEWYLKNGYEINWMSFPKNFDKNDLVSTSQEEIFDAVETEYDQSKYISATKSIKQLYCLHEASLTKFINDIHLSIIPSVVVNLTVYGMSGSYSLPNKVIINILKSHDLELIKTLLHEIIHLHIQHLIDKHKISQWKKEAVVNLLFKTAFPDLYKENKIPINTKNVETVYKTHFPDIEKIISLI